MNRKTFFPFFLILAVLVVSTLGCGSSGGKLSEQTGAAKFTKGIFNSTLRINGAEKTELSLTSEQPAEVGIMVRNIGPNDIKNLTIRAIGCVDIPADKNMVSRETLQKGATDYFSWSVRAPELGMSESFSCPLILRACFEEVSNGYVEVVVLPEDYREEPSTPNYYFKSGIFTTEPNFGIFRVINDNDIYYGTIKIKNTGSGWIDYVKPSSESQLGIHKINRISMRLSEDSKLQFYRIGEMPVSGKSISIESGKLGNSEYLLKMIGGQELNLRVGLTAPDKSAYTEQTFENIDYTIESGYCIDLATVNVKMSGR